MNYFMYCTHYFSEEDKFEDIPTEATKNHLVGPKPIERYERNQEGDLVRTPIGKKFERIPHLGNKLYKI